MCLNLWTLIYELELLDFISTDFEIKLEEMHSLLSSLILFYIAVQGVKNLNTSLARSLSASNSPTHAGTIQ